MPGLLADRAGGSGTKAFCWEGGGVCEEDRSGNFCFGGGISTSSSGGGGVSMIRGTGVSFLGNELVLGSGSVCEGRVRVSVLDGGPSTFTEGLRNTSPAVLEVLVCCEFCIRRPPRFGREKFSVEVG